MSDKAKQEFSLDQFSEAETDEEFGMAEFKEHFADTLAPAVLRDWTATDFASIYVRFRPHLERHAKRFLVNPHQVEEVVQDAFLYLMTALPELDSELGVLKFLKWKVRMLSLDLIRSGRRPSVLQIDEVSDLAAEFPEVSENLERADDAAVVSLALSKLSPRHRNVLLGIAYEEKTSEDLAREMGLSQNAVRQLILRARRSFKVALVGEAEIAGLRPSEILSIATKKASMKLGALSAAVIVGLSLFALGSGPTQIEFLEGQAHVEFLEGQAHVQLDSHLLELDASSRDFPGRLDTQSPPPEDALPTPTETQDYSDQSASPVGSLVADSWPAGNAEVPLVAAEQVLASLLDSDVLANLALPTRGASFSQNGRQITVNSPAGLSAHVAIDFHSQNNPAQYVYFTILIKDHALTAVPKSSLVTVEASRSHPDAKSISIGAMDFVVGDLEGSLENVSADVTHLLRIGIHLQLEVLPDGSLISEPILGASLLG